MTVSSANRIGVAVWGLGHHARTKLLPALASCAHVRLVGLHTRDSAIRTEEARRYDCRAFASEAAMLDDPAVAAVVVATPNALHKMHALAAIDAGKHVWCEKPLACTEADAVLMTDAARRRGVVLGEMLMYLQHSQFRKVRAMIQEGAIGAVRSVASRLGLPDWPSDNIRYRADLGGGALLDAAIYPLSFAMTVAGSAPQSVSAWQRRDRARGVDTAGAALLGFADGLSGIAEWGYGRFYRNEAEIWGEDGVLIVPRAFAKLRDEASEIVLRTKGGDRIVGCPAEDAFGATFAAFAAAIDDAEARDRLGADAVARMKLMDAVRAAS